MQKQKKHYWTQALLATILISCGLGIASGFQFSARNTIDPSRGCTNEMTWLEVLESLFDPPMNLYSELVLGILVTFRKFFFSTAN